jgi:acyl-CoA thioesterase 8
MVKSTSGTLIRPPPADPSKSQIENVLELTPIADIGPDIFTNTRPLWHPPGARGIFGGAAIAQSLAAAQMTIPPPTPENRHTTFLVHSMHCYFVLAGDSSIPVLYHVERVRDGRSFVTRTVQARQRGKCIFTTTISFVREGSAGKATVDHEAGLPELALADLEAVEEEEGEQWTKGKENEQEKASGGVKSENKIKDANGGGGPFVAKRMEVLNSTSPYPHTKRCRQWIRARGKISPEAGMAAHLSALAYMSDSYFIGTVSRVHGLWRFGQPSAAAATSSSTNNNSASPSAKPSPPPPPPSSSISTTNPDDANEQAAIARALKLNADLEQRENSPSTTRRIGMMVSLDHSIYFHRPRAVRADEWMFTEMESPWAGDGRGLVLQRIWNRAGELVATCVQEGVVRLEQDKDKDKKKKKNIERAKI